MSHTSGKTPHSFLIFQKHYSPRNRRNTINPIKGLIRDQQQNIFLNIYKRNNNYLLQELSNE